MHACIIMRTLNHIATIIIHANGCTVSLKSPSRMITIDYNIKTIARCTSTLNHMITLYPSYNQSSNSNALTLQR